MKISKSKRVIMYYRIKKYLSEGFSISKISRELNISRKTIYFYNSMNEQQFMDWNAQANKKELKLSRHEEFVRSLLSKQQDFSAAQIHDRLLELEPDLLVTERTTFNFVQYIRQKYNLPKPPINRRVYESVPELPYGKQAQVDFGEFTMQNSEGKNQKVYFMTMSLSRSRFKHTYFLTVPFTARTAVIAHEESFKYIGGIPGQIVYDQDSVFVSDENKGDFLLTEVFQRYVSERKFLPDFLHKADPESKGKIENVVKYVKYNFLRGRIFINNDVLNQQAIAWLERTANKKIHGTTKKSPVKELQNELEYLKTYYPVSQINPLKQYTLRKDNKVCYKGNFYTVPTGTYKGRGSKVFLMQESIKLKIYLKECINGKQEKKLIAEHVISKEKGKTIINTDHLRDKEKSIREMITQVTELFSDKQKAGLLLNEIYAVKPRYIRDQLQTIRNVIINTSADIIGQSLEFCMENRIFSAADFKAVAQKFSRDTEPVSTTGTNLPGTGGVDAKSNMKLINTSPDTSRIDTYENIITNI